MKARRTLLAVFFAIQAIVASAAYLHARVEGHAQRFGWQMFTGHTDPPIVTLVYERSQVFVNLSDVIYKNRPELNEELLQEDDLFEFLCAHNDGVVAVHATLAGHTRVVTCHG